MRLRLIGYCALIFACACDSSPKENSIEADSTATVVDSLIVKPEKIDSTIIEANYQVNDTLNAIAQIIGGSLNNETKVYDYLIKNKDYLNFSNSFNNNFNIIFFFY